MTFKAIRAGSIMEVAEKAGIIMKNLNPSGRAGMNGHQGMKPRSPHVKMAFSLEEAPSGNKGFFTSGQDRLPATMRGPQDRLRRNRTGRRIPIRGAMA